MFCSKFFLCVVIGLLLISVTNQRSFLDYFLDFPIEPPENPVDIIRSNGYPVEEHEVVTEDGYILLLQRIPNRNVQHGNVAPVLLFHGLGSSSGDYINLYPNISLGYVLSDAGYDVWLANSRGSSCNSRHVRLDPKINAREFYDYSWHEIGVYDNPVIIDYIINKTNHQKIFYIGYSQGATSLYVMLSIRPEYNQKLRLATLLAPAGFLKHYPIFQTHILSRFVFQLKGLLDSLGIYNTSILGRVRTFLNRLCKSEANLELCKTLFLLGGEFSFTDDQLLKEYIPLITRTTPAEGSVKQYFHYLQEIRSGKFCAFDYGPTENLKVYGNSIPPDYNVTKITIPVAFYYGLNDRLVSPKDVRAMMKLLPNVVMDHVIQYEAFNHLDFIFGKDLPSLLYKNMLNIMQHY